MSLYGDLPQAKDDAGGANQSKGWASAASKLQPSLRKPAGVLAPPLSVLRAGGAGGRGPGPAGRVLPPPSGGRGGGGRGPGRPPQQQPDGSGGGGGGAAGVNGGSSSGEPGAGEVGAAAAAASGPAGAATGGGPIVVSALGFFSTHGEPIAEEYDPMRPNDYEDELRAREKKRREAEEEAERVRRQREAEMELERRKREQAEAVAAVLAAGKPPEQRAAAAAAGQQHDDGAGSTLGLGHPQVKEEQAGAADTSERERRLKLSGEEAFAARARLSRGGPTAAAGPGPGSSGAAAAAAAAAAGGAGGEGPKGMGLAQKLLEKMGWREGEGLGRHRQGIATPLIAQKRGDHAAVIVNAPERPRPRGERFRGGDDDAPPEKRPRPGASLVGTPSRVLALRNMVGPGEVDEDLEEEVGIELSKYGQVVDVRIFEVLLPGYDPAEAVRIFVAFDRVEAAVKASVDLQGRFFGGKEVRVAFFPEERFDKQDLAPAAGEFGAA